LQLNVKVLEKNIEPQGKSYKKPATYDAEFLRLVLALDKPLFCLGFGKLLNLAMLVNKHYENIASNTKSPTDGIFNQK
jgi:hypothetical protein